MTSNTRRNHPFKIQWCQQNRPSYSNPLHTDYPGILHKDQGVAMIHPAATIGSPGLKLAEDTIHMNLEGLTYAKLPSNYKLLYFNQESIIFCMFLCCKNFSAHLVTPKIGFQIAFLTPPADHFHPTWDPGSTWRSGKKFNGEVANPTLKNVIQR